MMTMYSQLVTLNQGNPKWSQSVPIWDRSPWIETDYGHKLISEAERPLLSSSHLPFQLFPKSFFSSKAKDIRSNIEKICQFLGKNLEPEELELVVNNSSFQNMKNNKMTNFSMLHENILHSDCLLTRKGVSGDWKTHFTVAQADAFNKVYQEKMLGYPPGLFPWE
ncbi:bile salt sulfotransferase-like isoform X4 [Octodon degus]|uniref:Sulfotransferase n=1 Tax=Octodon degus TaxID=10160 RepID=A0A6P6DWF7_OCTDE|nr:bile salt sulfotransferase-like isoform X4 [Octodon degus]